MRKHTRDQAGSGGAAEAPGQEGRRSAGRGVSRRKNAPCASAAGGRPERLRATVLAVELRGLAGMTAAAEPRRVAELLGDVFTVLADVAVAHRAQINAPVGSTLLLLFGGPRRDGAARAVRAALDMQQALLAVRNCWLAKGWEPARDLALGAGISTDLLLIANVELSAGASAVPVGEAVSRAMRLCHGAVRGECLIDEPTYAAVRPALDEEAVFTSREAQRGGESASGYRVQRRRAGLHPVPEPAPTDPVCRVRLKASLAIRRSIAGRTVYFCSRRCAERFAADPQKFAS